MKIVHIEIQNFRRLKSVRVDFDAKTTMFVGANNSGKTSAMVALRYFLLSPDKLNVRDITLANWEEIDKLGLAWENDEKTQSSLGDILPALDVWLDVPLKQIQHVVHILPTINWSGGLLGVRLKYEPDDIEKMKAKYLEERDSVKKMFVSLNDDPKKKPWVWPGSLTQFLERQLSSYISLKAYCLDPSALKAPDNGAAIPQVLPTGALPLEGNPFKGLIQIDEIAAQRDFSDTGDDSPNRTDGVTRRHKRKLSEQLRSYYDKHLDPTKTPSEKDLEAISAIQQAEGTFDTRLRMLFSPAIQELEDLGYPGVNNPKIRISTQLRASDGLKHGSAVEYTVIQRQSDELNALRLPEHYSGLGYQNLIAMVFMLIAFRDEWMRIGKARKNTQQATQEETIPPLHFVLVEEPEAHLHAQVQQVFVKKAYNLLRNNDRLREQEDYTTQLVISTHSSHVAHEADFSALRYFRRRMPNAACEAPTTTVANLSEVFGDKDKTQRFVKRYLKATHCDLFFADAVVFVEGQAERILVPHFIRCRFDLLSRRYVTILDLGGSHAHRFKKLIELLGLTTLIIGDLDAGVETELTNDDGTTKRSKDGVPLTRIRKAAVEAGAGQVTSNPLLKEWHPALSKIDDLLELDDKQHATRIDDECDLYVAYQKPIKQGDKPVMPRTFEDALILANLDLLKELAPGSVNSSILKVVKMGLPESELAEEIFEIIKRVEKAEFALDCLMLENAYKLAPPDYINRGLTWLEARLEVEDSLTGEVKA